MWLLLLGCVGALSDKFIFGEDPTDTAPDPIDTAPPTDLDCDLGLDTPAPGDCLTGSLSCGDVLQASTGGGHSQYTDTFYETAYCFVPYATYTGPERIYSLVFEDAHYAEVVLASPCRDLAFAVARWEPTDSCPPEDNHQILECEGKKSSGGGRLTLSSPSSARYLVMVDGPEANFELRVECP